MAHPSHTLPEEFDLQTLDKIPMEDKIILAHEETLTPGEISAIINEQMRELPEGLVENGGSEIFDLCYAVVEEALHRLKGEF